MGEYRQILQDDPGMQPGNGGNKFDSGDRVGKGWI